MHPSLSSFVVAANRVVGRFFPRKFRQKVYWWLNPPDPRKAIDLVFDIVGSCNLKCPSCPVGSVGAINPAGKMDLVTYEKILEKATREYVVQNLVLYNWAEAILHPDLPKFVTLAKARNLSVLLSSNLNVLRNEEEILKAKPDMIRISLSGFTQEVYGKTHKGGDIERVKENMRRLSETKRRLGNTETAVTVYYHKYRNNLHEVAAMKAFCEELGFGFGDTWAYYMPYEKAADLMEGRVTPAEEAFIENDFALPIRKAIKAAQEYKDDPCLLLENQVVLDLKGNLLLCCAVYDYGQNKLGSFFDLTPEMVLQAKANRPSCERCAKHGLHKYFLYQGDKKLAPLYERFVAENLALIPGAAATESPEEAPSRYGCE